jgi:hypothetical protein
LSSEVGNTAVTTSQQLIPFRCKRKTLRWFREGHRVVPKGKMKNTGTEHTVLGRKKRLFPQWKKCRETERRLREIYFP